MKKLIDKIKTIPKWGYAAGIFFFVLQRALYSLGEWLSRITGNAAHAFEWKIPAIDDLIPVIPVFVVIYLFSFAFWICAPVAVSLTSRKNFRKYCIGLSLAYLIGFVFFVFVPTYMDRVKEGLLELANRPGIFNKLLKIVYEADGTEMAYNLVPSYHCLISAYCYLGVRRQPEISRGFKVYSLVMAILICMSTVFTKQHYIIDVILGIGISIGCYVLINLIDSGKKA